jgi:photosystem II stability/assembly factor-like uncharacterized protein
MENLRRVLAAGALLLAVAAPVSAGWSPVGGPSEPIIEMQLDPDRPELLYALVAGYLWKSGDAGSTWRTAQIGLGRPSSAFAIDPADPKVVWVWARRGELWRSGDGGETWSRRFATRPDRAPRVLQLLVDPCDSRTLYRLDEANQSFNSGTRVTVSHDGGASFQRGAFMPRSWGFAVRPRCGELASFDENGFRVSADGGVTWRVQGRYNGKGFWGGRLAPSDLDTVYGLPVNADCPIRSDDGGAHWHRLECPRLPVSNWGFSEIAVDPRDARHVWLAAIVELRDRNGHWLFESRNGGESWSPPFLMPNASVVPAGGRVVYTDSGRSEFGGAGLFGSQDGGRTWKPKDHGIFAGDARNGLVAQRPPGGGAGRRLVALNRPAVDTSQRELFRSDGGKDWVRLPFLEPGSIADAGGSTLVVTAREGVFRSEDGGDSWSLVASAPPEAFGVRSDLTQPRYLSLHAFEENERFGDIAFWTSDDGGATWRRSSEGLPIACTHVAGEDDCPSYSSYAVDPFDSTRRWVASDARWWLPSSEIFVSEDAGHSWRRAAAQLPGTPGIRALAADPRSEGRLLAATYAGLFVSEDRGEHWRPLGDGFPRGAWIYQLAYDPRVETWYAATYGHGIYRSFDGGASWTVLEGALDLEAPRIAVDPRSPGALLVAFGGHGVWLWKP